jgi:ABC-type branched-subunit amino acid transport system substrate-binding protein
MKIIHSNKRKLRVLIRSAAPNLALKGKAQKRRSVSTLSKPRTKIGGASSGLIAVMLIITVFLGCEIKTTFNNRTGVTDNEIIIGSSCALSGYASFLGTQTIHGSLAYINEVNTKGGVHGRNIRLISYDDQYDHPSKTLTNTQRLITQDRIFALFDYTGTPTSIQVIDIVHELEIPLLGLFTGAEALRVPFRPYIFNIRDSYYNEAEGAVAYFVDRLGFKKIAVMYQKDDFGLSVLKGVQLALERRNLEPVVTATVKRGEMNVREAAEIIKSSAAQAVVMAGTYRPLAKFIKVSHELDYAPYFHTVSFVGSEAFSRELIEIEKIKPQEYKKIIVTQVVPSPFLKEFPAVKEYTELIKKYYPEDEPNFVALEGYINAKVLVEALERAGKDLNREKFINALESMQEVNIGIGKGITYSTLDHQGLEGVYYSRLREDGRFTVFNP